MSFVDTVRDARMVPDHHTLREVYLVFPASVGGIPPARTVSVFSIQRLVLVAVEVSMMIPLKL